MLRHVFFICILSSFLVACNNTDTGHEGENEKSSHNKIEKLIWNKENIIGKNGKPYLKVRLNNEILEIPKEYIGQNPPSRPFFDVVVLWPGLLPVKAIRNSEHDYNPITIMFVSKNDNTHSAPFRDSYSYLKDKLNKKVIAEPTKSPDFPGMERYEHPAKMAYYQLTNNLITTPSGHPLVANCTWQKQEGDETTFCSVDIAWSEELTFRYRFNRSLLNHLPDIHPQIINLVRSFYGR